MDFPVQAPTLPTKYVSLSVPTSMNLREAPFVKEGVNLLPLLPLSDFYQASMREWALETDFVNFGFPSIIRVYNAQTD